MVKKIIFHIAFIIVVLFASGCGDDNKITVHLTSFDISPDGRFIVYSFSSDGNKSDLYRVQLVDKSTKVLASEKGYSFSSPKFSEDGSKVIFVGNNIKAMESSIWQIYQNGDSIKRIVVDKGYISEVIYSKYDKRLFYLKANEYKSYSPITPGAMHNFDIYSLGIDSLNVKKISNVKAYSLNSLEEFNKFKLIVSQRGIDIENGIFLFGKNSDSGLERIETKNDELRNSTGYSNPNVVTDTTILCSSYYQLVKIDLENKLEKIILPSNGYHFKEIRYNKRLKGIFFTKSDDTNTIYSVDINGRDFQEIVVTNVHKS